MLRKSSSSKVGKETYHLYKYIYLLAEGVESVDELTFDLKFEHSLFKSKSESDLSQMVFDPKLFNPITTKKFSNFSAKDQKKNWDTLSPYLNKELLIESPINSQSPNFFVKSKFEFFSQPLFSATSPIKGDQTPVASPSIDIHSTPPIHIPTTPIPIVTPYQTPTPNLSPAMAARFAPLVLPAQLHDLPQAYSQRIKTYGVEGDITTQQHLDMFNDFFNLEEVDHEDAKLRQFAQSFSGEVKKWFRGL